MYGLNFFNVELLNSNYDKDLAFLDDYASFFSTCPMNLVSSKVLFTI